MGYREYAKDFEIEYTDRPGKKRPKAVRIYVGPYFQLKASPERVRWLQKFYLAGLLACSAALLIPMCIDCVFTRTWYIQVPAAAAWIPWIFAACATWRLWTAKEKVTREHNALLGARMNGACLFLMGLCMVSFAGCLYATTGHTPETVDYVICSCCMLSGICGIALFSKRKGLDMVRIES